MAVSRTEIISKTGPFQNAAGYAPETDHRDALAEAISELAEATRIHTRITRQSMEFTEAIFWRLSASERSAILGVSLRQERRIRRQREHSEVLKGTVR
jgi:hypothetical protein